jgi:phage protein D
MASNNGTGSRAARPKIAIDDRDQPELAKGLLGMTIAENTAGLYRCEAMFGNWGNTEGRIDFVYFDRRTLDFGKSFKITYDDETLFEGRIMALEANFPETGSQSITVLAEDRFQDLRMTRRTRTFADMSDSDVIRRIATSHGLTPEIDLAAIQHKVLAQVNQSDLAFLRDRARSVDAEVWMDGRKLYAKSRPNRDLGTLQLDYREGLREFSALADLVGQRTSVTVSGWDVAGKQAIAEEATESILRGELNGDLSGIGILQQALGARKEQLAHTVPLTAQEAQAQAEAHMKISARRFVTAHGLASIQPKLRVGSNVELRRLGPLFSGKYYVTEVWHRFDRAGIRTEFTAERPGLGR